MSATLPENRRAERAVLGAMLFRPEKLDEVRGIVSPESFYDPSHRLIFSAMLELSARGSAIDPLTVASELRRREVLGRVEGGEQYLVDLLDETPTAENVEHYAEVVAERERRRQLVLIAREIAARAMGAGEDTDTLVDWAEARIFELAERRTVARMVSDTEAVEHALRSAAERAGGKQLAGLKTGFSRLDKILGGLQAPKLYLVGARPGVGKSAFALAIADRVCFGDWSSDPPTLPAPVLVFSLEMAAKENAERLIAGRGHIEVGRMGTGEMTGEDWKRFYQGASVYLDASRLAAEALEYRCQITFDESPDVNVNHIRSTARRWAAVQERARVERQARGALVSPHRGLIVVDYAQLVAPLPHEKGRRDVMRHEQIGEVSRGLKSLSKQLEMPVLALAALNRDLEKRENKRPILSDLRECGQLEADADVVLFLYRASEYEDDADPEIAEVIIGKHRGGAKGTVRLRFNAAEIAFSDFDENDPRGHAPAGAAARTNGHGRRPRRGRGSFAALSAPEDE